MRKWRCVSRVILRVISTRGFAESSASHNVMNESKSLAFVVVACLLNESNMNSFLTYSYSLFSLLTDDMIKNRRRSTRSTTTRRAAARKPTAADKAAGRQRATRTAKINARRGIQQNANGKPSAMEIEREVYRQTRMSNTPNKGKKKGTRSRKESNQQVKARKQTKAQQKKKAQQKAAASVPSTWVAGTRRPPSKKAVNAAVTAMTDAGFKVPKNMQMVISFAPAPEQKPPAKKKGGGQQNKKGGASQKGGNKGKQNKSRGGRRKK